jgi:hypothetical protein
MTSRPEEHSEGQQDEKQQPVHIGISLLGREDWMHRRCVPFPQSVNLPLLFPAAK